ncbi:uncharacterized protein N7479_005471 [Penicillium vulpinum]|uniref:Uncharacterized protein n=1 Tax=Penicillium vulpinum TaxID=29845 RepID=A0A1V6SFF8_9EURO|nr:uncharacterized protein N7479_005471 [Penicillium vulpinum]KAJ5958321.1 hypothetical protein N7479_005471 [Penicillium vulpinum]OQE12489.1 hypothetical protein PENVUL_c001G08866 [Penicillium vulpinum]
MEGSRQQTRESILGQIPDTIQSFLQTVDTRAIRILGDTPNSVLDPGDYLGSVRPFVSKVESSLRQHCPDNQTSFLAVNIYPGHHSYFVLDLNNVHYDYETAHNDMCPIPVYVLRLSKRKPTIFRREALDKTLAETLASMHNGHGHEPLPLFDNYNEIVQYRNPRSLES